MGGPRVLRTSSWPARSNVRGNPYNHLLTGELERLGVHVEEFSLGSAWRNAYDVVHVHWPEWVLDAEGPARRVSRSAALLATLARARRRGARLVWTAHNLGGHERVRSERARGSWRAFTDLVDGWIALTPSSLAAVRAWAPHLARVPSAVIPHGHYRGAYPDHMSREDARDRLAVQRDDRVLLFFGRLRPYKGVAELIGAFRRAAEDDCVLLIAGRPHSDALLRELAAAAGGDPRVRLHLRFVDAPEVQVYLRAADAVVLPYHELLNSGTAMLALSFDRPVVAPRRGSFVDLQAGVGERWVHVYDGPLTEGTLREALATAPPSPGAQPDLDLYAWDGVAQRTLELYRRVTEAVPDRGRPRRSARQAMPQPSKSVPR